MPLTRITLILSLLMVSVLKAYPQCLGGGVWPSNTNPTAGTTFNTGTIQGSVSVDIRVIGGAAAGRPMWTRGNQTYNAVTWRSLRVVRGESFSGGNYTYFKLSTPLPPSMIHFRISDIRGDGFNTESHAVRGFLNGVGVNLQFEDLIQGAYVGGNTIYGPSTSTSAPETQGAGRIFFDGAVDSVVFQSTGLSDYVILDIFSRCEVLLPFVLQYFRAVRESDLVRLSWASALATNFDTYIIQRSRDLIHWENIGVRRTEDHDINADTYIFTDNNPASGRSYYRLHARDHDGTVSYSAVATVNIPTTKEKLLKLASNPFNSMLSIQVFQNSSLKVYASDGRLIHSQRVTRGQILIQSSHWKKGMYVIDATNDSGYSEKLRAVKF